MSLTALCLDMSCPMPKPSGTKSAVVPRPPSPATKELARWVAKIVDQPTARLFVAGDGGMGTTADFVPEGFGIGQLISRHKAVSDKWGPE